MCLGSYHQSYSCRPTPEPQQLGIWATSVTYTTAHSNDKSLTHWTRPGIEPVTLCFLRLDLFPLCNDGHSLFLIFNFFVLLGPHPRHMEVPRLGVELELLLLWSCCHWPTPQLQQQQIRVMSGTYSTAHGNTGSLTHWARPGIKPTSSRILVGLVNRWAMAGTPYLFNLKIFRCWVFQF